MLTNLTYNSQIKILIHAHIVAVYNIRCASKLHAEKININWNI